MTRTRTWAWQFKASSPIVLENDAKSDEASEEISDKFRTSSSKHQLIEDESIPPVSQATDERIFEKGVNIKPFDENDELSEFVSEIF